MSAKGIPWMREVLDQTRKNPCTELDALGTHALRFSASDFMPNFLNDFHQKLMLIWAKLYHFEYLIIYSPSVV